MCHGFVTHLFSPFETRCHTQHLRLFSGLLPNRRGCVFQIAVANSRAAWRRRNRSTIDRTVIVVNAERTVYA